MILAIVGGTLLLLFGGCAAIVAVAGDTSSQVDTTPTRNAPDAIAVDQSASAEPEPEPEPAEMTPKPRDIKIDIKILKKKCFGSAGCNITYRISPTYIGPGYSEDIEWQVVYEVRGGEDGPQINSFTLHDEQIEYQSEEFVSVSSSATKLRGRVTEVMKN
ncbi:hypothetical protein ACFHYQ_25585 [Sphaerimonospora cavernae]|uniref:Lipoprotein n=1 Tax=Sphaerimonospora cavernae TaxID=1740611 RepID=A0ABV6UBY7_9ACTN